MVAAKAFFTVYDNVLTKWEKKCYNRNEKNEFDL